MSRVTYDTIKQADGHRIAHINDLIPPDEYVDHVNDSVYTNFVASQALLFTVQAAEILQVNCANCKIYSQIANDLNILFDETLQIHPEYSGYPNDIIKQADVVLLSYPLGMKMTDEIRKNDLDFYSERTDPHGPAMTWGMHSIGYLDIHDYSNAAKYFNMSFQDNMHAPLHVWTETPDGNACKQITIIYLYFNCKLIVCCCSLGNFITGAGGFLQTVLAGYGGVRLAYGSLMITPVCGENMDSMKIRSMNYLGNTFDYQTDCNEDKNIPMKITIVMTGKQANGQTLQLIGPLSNDEWGNGNANEMKDLKKKILSNNNIIKVMNVHDTYSVELKTGYGTFAFVSK